MRMPASRFRLHVSGWGERAEEKQQNFIQRRGKIPRISADAPIYDEFIWQFLVCCCTHFEPTF